MLLCLCTSLDTVSCHRSERLLLDYRSQLRLRSTQTPQTPHPAHPYRLRLKNPAHKPIIARDLFALGVLCHSVSTVDEILPGGDGRCGRGRRDR
jgi:hypothetical protein